MVQLGMGNASALMAATAWAAELLRIDGETGMLTDGLAADMLVLERDPSEDIEVLTDQRAIRAVIQGGRIVRSNLNRNEE